MYIVSSRLMLKPAATMRSGIARLRWQPPHLAKRIDRVGNRAERVGREHGIDAVVLERDLVARQGDELDLEWRRPGGTLNRQPWKPLT
jgi:hypothetical protein